jgi:hypothetical protein
VFARLSFEMTRGFTGCGKKLVSYQGMLSGIAQVAEVRPALAAEAAFNRQETTFFATFLSCAGIAPHDSERMQAGIEKNIAASSA